MKNDGRDIKPEPGLIPASLKERVVMRRVSWTIPLSLLALALLAPTAGATEKTSPPASIMDQGAFDAADCKTCHEAAVTKMEATKHGTLEQSCASCHDRDKALLHSKDRAEGKETPGPAVKDLKADEINTTCLGCHEKGNQASWASSKHDSRKVACTTCHSVHSFKSEKAQLKTKTDAETCYSCHQTERAQGQRTSHHPVREGKMGCVSCHNPHDGSRPKMIKAESVNELCYTCHTEKRGPFLFEHAPVREDCVSCHTPHGSNHKRLLVQKLPNLCWNCHLTGSGHFGSGDNLSTERGARVAPPGSPSGYPTANSRWVEKSCKNCHMNLHGSNSPSGAFFIR
jgi:DmsE family decaheme c-type cytochrome